MTLFLSKNNCRTHKSIFQDILPNLSQLVLYYHQLCPCYQRQHLTDDTACPSTTAVIFSTRSSPQPSTYRTLMTQCTTMTTATTNLPSTSSAMHTMTKLYSVSTPTLPSKMMHAATPDASTAAVQMTRLTLPNIESS